MPDMINRPYVPSGKRDPGTILRWCSYFDLAISTPRCSSPACVLPVLSPTRIARYSVSPLRWNPYEKSPGELMPPSRFSLTPVPSPQRTAETRGNFKSRNIVLRDGVTNSPPAPAGETEKRWEIDGDKGRDRRGEREIQIDRQADRQTDR